MMRYQRPNRRRSSHRMFPEEAHKPNPLVQFLHQGFGKVAPILQRLGLIRGKSGDPNAESLLALTDFPATSELPEIVGKLPESYVNFFDFEPLTTEDLLVGREKELETLMGLFERWRSDKPSSVAIMGPQGSGKTTLLNIFSHRVGAHIPVVRKQLTSRLKRERDVLTWFTKSFDLKKDHSGTDSIVEEIRESSKRLVVIEGWELTMLRVLGGREAAEAFCYIILSTREHWFWAVAVNRYPWRRMDYHFNVSRYFTHTIETIFHNEAGIKEAVMKRHGESGFPLLFLEEGISDLTLRRLRRSNPLESEIVQKELSEIYFENLFDLSGGNMLSALFFWLITLQYDPSRSRIEVKPFPRIQTGFLKNLDRRYLFTLAELLGNGGLTLSEHREIFRMAPSDSRIILDYLCGIRLVERTNVKELNGEGRYRINPAFYESIGAVLESMNILY